MLSTKECKNELNKDGERYTDEEVSQIREILYQLASIEFEQYKNNADDKESISSSTLCKSIHRGTKEGVEC